MLPSDLNRSHSRNFGADFRLVNDALRAFANSRYLQEGYRIYWGEHTLLGYVCVCVCVCVCPDTQQTYYKCLQTMHTVLEWKTGAFKCDLKILKNNHQNIFIFKVNSLQHKDENTEYYYHAISWLQLMNPSTSYIRNLATQIISMRCLHTNSW